MAIVIKTQEEAVGMYLSRDCRTSVPETLSWQFFKGMGNHLIMN